MKKILVPIALIAGSMLVASCSEDWLEVEQKAVSSTETFYKTDEDAESALMAMYATYADQISGNNGIWSAYIMGLNYSADDVFAAGGDCDDHSGFRELNEFRFDAGLEPIKELYNRLYKSIYSANLIVNYFGGDKADTKKKKEAVAEARVMRAWAHMLAALVYYQPPLVDHLITDDVPVNAESQKEILDWCVKECEEAIADINERQGQGDKQGAWRATKGFAQFVGGKAALFAGDNAKVVSIMKDLVESPNYALVSGDRFRDLFHVEGDGCEEKIFEINYSTNTAAAGGTEAWRGANGRGRWMVANVLNWRGDDIIGGGKNPQICSTGGWGGGSINHIFAHKMLDNDGDSYRRKATFLTSDEFFYDATLCPWADDVEAGGSLKTRAEKEYDFKRGIDNSDGSFSRSDVMEVKMMMHPNDCAPGAPVGDNCNQTNLCLARLAEAYLIYAEACLATGNNAEALKYVNLIQERAGSKTISTSVDLQVIQDEKEYELWFEGCRWHDIVRWGIAKECYDKVLDNIPYQFDEFWSKSEFVWVEDIDEKTGEVKIDEKTGKPKMKRKTDENGNPIINNAVPHKLVYEVRHPFKDIKGLTLEFKAGKNEYWPIPQSILDINPAMHQVRGWQ
ncbi:MAG: RagB/SusD family nutrient uptake outer membrane protein [Marinilabiliaceae bacterium]|nr:RagB/SusD family nutrient uptake outer membrane protein [Marinilabiliaceae bacterium]